MQEMLYTYIFYEKYCNTKTLYNKEFVLGNSAGNLYNGGLFCKQEDTIYFSNMNDDGALYTYIFYEKYCKTKIGQV